MDCVNLKKRFGKQCQIRYEESYYTQYGLRARVDDPWLQIIPCRRGHICPWGGSTLAAVTDWAGPTACKLAALDFAMVHQDGSDGVTVLFPVERFSEVAELMRPRRRRQMTEEQRLAAAERLAKYAFTPARQSAAEGQTALAMAEMVSASTRATGTQ
jgi:hypothetical protein